MPRDSSTGTYTFPTGNTFAPTPVSNTVLSSTDATSVWSDLATGISTCVGYLNGQTGVLKLAVAPMGRLTLATATPVMTASQSAKTTIYYTPYVGDQIPIYDGTNMIPTTFTEISVATSDTTKNPAAIGASKVNDWFVWSDSGTMRLSHGPDWTNDTTRSAGTALTMVKGIYLNSVAITNGPGASRGTYVGTTRSDGSSQLNYVFGASASGGTAASLYVWNAYNRVATGTTVTDSGTNYTYASSTVRQARASTGNQVNVVIGLSEEAVSYSYTTNLSLPATTSSRAKAGVAFDLTNAFSKDPVYIRNPQGTNAFEGGGSSAGQWFPGIGVHFIAAVESSPDNSTSATFDLNSAATLDVIIRN